MSSTTMPAADAAWLHMDRDTNPMVVNGLLILDRVPDLDVVTRQLQERLVERYPRFRQRVSDPLGRTPRFEDDPAFDLGDHVHRISLPGPGDRVALQGLLGDLVTPPIDPGKPLWHVYLIEGFEGGAAMLWRIHHCIADGIALAQVMLATTDEDPGASPPPSRRGDGQGVIGRIVGIPRRAVSAARGAGTVVLHEGMETVAHPDHLRDLGRAALREASTAAKLVAAPADAPSPLRAPLTGTRRVAWSKPTPLATVKDIGHLRSLTVNDVLLTALSGALREALGGAEAPEEIHAMVPFNLRPAGERIPAELGNDFALILLPLPLGDVPRPERLRQVASRMEAIKRTREAPLSFGMISAIGLTPPWAEDRLIGFFTDKASFVVTNVPGPPDPLHFAGARIDRVLVWAPCSGSLGMTVSIFSYAGEVTAGFMADTAVLADPGLLARAYERELDALLARR